VPYFQHFLSVIRQTLFKTLPNDLKLQLMISITKTAYPRFKKNYNEQELNKIFEPNNKELRFCRKNARGKHQRLTLLALLKSHQYLGYLPNLDFGQKNIRRPTVTIKQIVIF